jgi:subtilisin family serine protease
MQLSRHFLLFTSFLVFTVWCVPAFAAEFSPELEYQLSNAAAGENVSAIVILRNAVDIGALDAQLHASKATKAERHYRVLEALHYNADQNQPAFRAELDAAKQDGQVVGYTAYWIEDLFVILASKDFINSLRPRGDVEYVTENFQAQPIAPFRTNEQDIGNPLDTRTVPPGIRAVGALRVAEEMGITGAGVLVSELDTGVDGTHPALQARWRGYNNAHPWWQCWRDGLGQGWQTPHDSGQHGTHTMGTICGRGISGADTQWVGCAPDAQWIEDNCIGFGGPWYPDPTFTNMVIDAFQWLTDPDSVTHDPEAVPDVCQNSWGVYSGLNYPQCFDAWNTVTTNCEAGGTVITWSAGNEGFSGLRSPAIYSLNGWQIYSVGAVDASNYPNTPYPIADFSSRGPTPCTPAIPDNIKPEVSAPGVNVYSSIPGGSYQGGWSGTSMAGPHVAGVVALMRQACPNCDPQTIKEAIMATCHDYGTTGDDNTYGHGFIDAWDAVNAVASLGRVDGTVTSSGNPLPGVRVESLTTGNWANTGANGYYNMVAPADTHTIRFTKFGYETITVPNVITIEGDTVHLDEAMNTVPMGILAGTVVTQVGIPIQNATVVIRNTPYDTLTSDANGHVYQANLPATTWQVWLQMTVNTTPPRVYTNTVDVDIQAGDTTFADLPITVTLVEPMGPDAYGYYEYDRYDRDLPAPADWVELDPDLGNPGIPFDFVHHDSAVYFQAPITIGFYGTDRDTLTVNPNGWMLPGEIHGAGAVNTPIPSNTNDPPGIIAPVWDDFRIGLGARQFSYYDTTNGRWIFEFVDQRLVTPNNRFLNWQVHFLDPARHPSITGDCDIIVVYHLMQYLNGCTIGIENPAETTGLQVRYNTIVDSTTWPVEDGAAIRYTTGHPSTYGHIAGTLTLYPSSNQITSAVIYAGGDLTSPAANGSFNVDSSGAGHVSMLLSLAGYESRRLSRVLVTANQTTNQNMAAWRLDPARNLSATQFNGNVTLTWRQPLCTESAPNSELRYNVYDDGVLLEGGMTDTTFSNSFVNGDTLVFTVEALYRYGTAPLSAPLEVLVDLAASEPNTALPTVYALYQNYPNPFNPTTTIRLDVPERADGALQVYDISGRLVRTLYSGAMNAGRYTFSWDSRDDHGNLVGTGMYFYRFNSHSYVATQKMLLVK